MQSEIRVCERSTERVVPMFTHEQRRHNFQSLLRQCSESSVNPSIAFREDARDLIVSNYSLLFLLSHQKMQLALCVQAAIYTEFVIQFRDVRHLIMRNVFFHLSFNISPSAGTNTVVCSLD